MTHLDKIAVLDDDTCDAIVIGYAATADEAAAVWLDYMNPRILLGDDETLTAPDFARRIDNAATTPCFEPLS